MFTEDDGRALYRQGEEAVVAFLVQMMARLIALEEQVAKNSGNSSKPPSSDVLGKKPLQPMTTSLRKKSGKKVGGQPGHAGTTLKQVDQPDEIVVHRLDSCPGCQASLTGVEPASDLFSCRQVFEIPQPKVVVTEHQVPSIMCPGCGNFCRATFPEGVDQPVQYGRNLLAFATYLHGVHLLPFARCAQVVQDITGAPFSPGSLDRALRTVHQVLEPFERAVKAALLQASVLHVDETGSRVTGKLNWFHVRCSKKLAYLFRHNRRGGPATDDLAGFNGTLVSDFWSSYVKRSCRHAYCGAHILRELTFQHQVKKQKWAGELIAIFEAAVSACHDARERGDAKVSNGDQLAAEFDRWVAEGLRINPPPLVGKATPTVNLLERLEAYKPSCLRFLSDLSIPFTNNEAERDLRMLKVKGKISGGFRTTEGADQYCRLRSYTATCRKQDMPLLESIQALFQNQLIMPSLVLE